MRESAHRIRLISKIDSDPMSKSGTGCAAAMPPEFGPGSGLLRHQCNNEQRRSGDCDIVVVQSVYQRIVSHLREDTTREHGGLLLGYEIASSDTSCPAIMLSHTIVAPHTDGTSTRLTFTFETWAEFDRITEQISQHNPSVKRIGWYHSHPNIPIFLSSHDLDVCTLFNRPTHVALVVDPIRDYGGFFVRGTEGYRPDIPQGFWELQDVQADSVVTWKNMKQSEVSWGHPNTQAQPNKKQLSQTPEDDNIDTQDLSQRGQKTFNGSSARQSTIDSSLYLIITGVIGVLLLIFVAGERLVNGVINPLDMLKEKSNMLQPSLVYLQNDLRALRSDISIVQTNQALSLESLQEAIRGLGPQLGHLQDPIRSFGPGLNEKETNKQVLSLHLHEIVKDLGEQLGRLLTDLHDSVSQFAEGRTGQAQFQAELQTSISALQQQLDDLRGHLDRVESWFDHAQIQQTLPETAEGEDVVRDNLDPTTTGGRTDVEEETKSEKGDKVNRQMKDRAAGFPNTPVSGIPNGETENRANKEMEAGQ